MSNSSIVDGLRRFALLIVTILLFAIFGIIEPRFRSLENIINIVRQTSIMGILAVGLTFVVVSGEIDLSFGAIASMASVLSIFLVVAKVSPWISWILVLLAGIALGYANAVIVIRLKIPALLGTIGTWLAIGGLVALMVNGATIWTATYPAAFDFPGKGKILGIIPAPVVTLILFSAIAIVLLNYTVLGRYFYAVGGNANAATHAGISTNNIKAIGFLFMGFLSGVAGITMSSMFASSTPTVGQQFFFPAIIAVYLGSILLTDGIPNIWGTVVASLFLSIISNGLIMIGLMWWWESIAQGLLMILAISVITVISKKKIKGVTV
jgi:ribose/xylose/arabinose/galactoside ABC-type transport system permease subunit